MIKKITWLVTLWTGGVVAVGLAALIMRAVTPH